MSLKVYDNLTREKRAFEPVSSDRVGMYVCGMTVQDKPHVGHMRAARRRRSPAALSHADRV